MMGLNASSPRTFWAANCPSSPSTMPDDRLQNARETLDSELHNDQYSSSQPALHDLSQLLQTGTHRLRIGPQQNTDAPGLDKQTLSICVGMIEAGANPDTLAVSLPLVAVKLTFRLSSRSCARRRNRPWSARRVLSRNPPGRTPTFRARLPGITLASRLFFTLYDLCILYTRFRHNSFRPQ